MQKTLVFLAFLAFPAGNHEDPLEFIKGYNVFAIYPNSSRRGLGYKFISLFNLLILYARGLVRLSIHKSVDEFQTKFGDGFWIRFVFKK